LLVEGGVDVRNVQRFDRRGQLLELSERRLERLRERELELV
jgi:hypothetical protein